ncbi:MAG: type IX secretion system sortase PorU [Gelidibacter sp.]
MKNFLLVLFFICSQPLLFSQQKTFNIEWEGSMMFQTSSARIEVPSFNKEHLSFNDDTGLLYVTEWESSNAVNESSATLENITYATIPSSELKGIPRNTIPRSPKIMLRNATARNKRSVYLQLTPIVIDNGIYKKITSFTVNYNTSSNRSSLAQAPPSIFNSVLSSGKWYRFYVDKSGVFKITKDFMSQLGVNTNVDPRTIKIYGNGGAMLPYLNSTPYPYDLTENAVKFVGEEDGVFNNQDYILLYAEGPKGNVEYVPQNNTNLNPYTDKSYYYVNISPGNGKRIQPIVQPSESADITIDTFQDYQFHEVDEFNIAKIGRRWFGDRFGIENSHMFTFNFPNLVTSEQAILKVYIGATSEVAGTSMDVNLNGTLVTNLTINPFADTTLATGNSYNSNVSLASQEAVVSLTFNNNGNPASLAYLDYISLEATRLLKFEGTQFFFKNKSVATTSGIVEYTMTNAASVSEIWDITDKYDVANVLNSDQASTLSFKAQAGTLRNYLVVTPSDYYQPLRDNNVGVSNQNLKGTIFKNAQGQFEDIDYIIVASNNYVSQAERLAQINRNQYGLNVKVVTLKEIYNEFSSGQQDIGAIRNFIKYVYFNASSEDNRLKYVCLFGDASYDYKDRISNNTNIVPSWYSYDSFSLTSSYISDDFYGCMDENEGDMNITSYKLDIAVGRILADTPQRAKDLVDKIESYYNAASYGSWRNNFLVISDDVDLAGEQQLQSTTDFIANDVSAQKPFINAIKIHSDSYQQEATASGFRYPKVNKAIKDAIEVGALVVNYFGHGGEDGLAHEFIFDKNDAEDIRNTCKYNCFVTVTCEFTKFDNPQRPTAGELIYWNKQGGSISLITTTREIFLTVGVLFNTVLEKYLFAFGSDEYPSMAEALRLAKNDPLISTQKQVVFSIGDPAMKLAFPKPNIKLTKINDIPIGQNTEVLKALGRVKLSGEVVDTAGNLIPNYNGTLTATVFDKNIQRATLGNDGVRINNQLVIMNFQTLGEKIFIGQATVNNGLFEFNFVVPRDIGIPVGSGKVSFYAKTDTPLQDEAGASFDIQIGGINENAEEDNIGPVINLFMNDENFVTGGITNESPTLLAKIQDSNGINTASGIGHDIVAVIDGDETNPFVLNDYYQANVDDFQNGKVSYPFRDLEPGLHTLTLKAWDVYNNSSIAEIQFVVHDKDKELTINNVLNYPNPFINYTEFWFNHNSSEPLDVSIQIFTISGKLVKTLNGQTGTGECCNQGASNLSRNIVWDGRDDFGDKIGKGVYVYKLKVRSNQLNKQVEKIEKLVIL